MCVVCVCVCVCVCEEGGMEGGDERCSGEQIQEGNPHDSSTSVLR